MALCGIPFTKLHYVELGSSYVALNSLEFKDPHGVPNYARKSSKLRAYGDQIFEDVCTFIDEAWQHDLDGQQVYTPRSLTEVEYLRQSRQMMYV